MIPVKQLISSMVFLLLQWFTVIGQNDFELPEHIKKDLYATTLCDTFQIKEIINFKTSDYKSFQLNKPLRSVQLSMIIVESGTGKTFAILTSNTPAVGRKIAVGDHYYLELFPQFKKNKYYIGSTFLENDVLIDDHIIHMKVQGCFLNIYQTPNLKGLVYTNRITKRRLQTIYNSSFLN